MTRQYLIDPLMSSTAGQHRGLIGHHAHRYRPDPEAATFLSAGPVEPPEPAIVHHSLAADNACLS